MSMTTLGTWRNPPLAYVVAELVISPYYSLESAIPKLQDSLRSPYPRTAPGQELVIDGSRPPSQQPVWSLVSGEQRQGVLLSTRAISLHVTSYRDSDEFLTRWAEVLAAVGAANLGAFVERAGLRYVDLIVPQNGCEPRDYLARGLQGIAPDGAEVQSANWAASFALEDCILNSRTAAPAPRGMVLPPNFNALPLHKPKIMVDAEECVRENKAIGIIDTDCLKDIQQVFDADGLNDVFIVLQELTSKTFKTVISELAQKEWQ
jgi:uncharacterized protein (TIGR04255 family)